MRRRWLPVAALIAVAAGSAHAGTLDRIHRAGALRCGAAVRPGFADVMEGGRVTGLAVDLCRALTIAVLGLDGRSAFHTYQSGRDYDAVRRGEDDVSFLTADAVGEHGLAAAVIPGPIAFVAELTVLARPGVDALAGRTVCLMNGSPSHQALEAWAGRTNTTFVRSGYQEDGEMHDAFDARRCDAMAGEATELAKVRAEAPARATARILPPLGMVPVFAATSTADGAWAGLVSWALGAVVQSETAPSPWRGDPPGLAVPGLRPGWLGEVAASLGGYGDMTRRAFGAGSPLALRAGPNAAWPEGLLLPPGPR